jgi:hypothetical protein
VQRWSVGRFIADLQCNAMRGSARMAFFIEVR